jgi:hypothetical protein
MLRGPPERTAGGAGRWSVPCALPGILTALGLALSAPSARAESAAAPPPASAASLPSSVDLEAARRGLRLSLSGRLGLLGAELSPLIDAPLLGFHGLNLSLDLPVSKRLRFGTELEVVGLANDLVIEHAGTLNGAAVSGTLVGIASEVSFEVLQLQRLDLEAQLLVGIVSGGTGDANFKVEQTAPALPDDAYDAGATLRFAGRAAAYYWLLGFESQKQSGALALFGSLGLDAHALWASASEGHAEPATGLYAEVVVQLGITLSSEL